MNDIDKVTSIKINPNETTFGLFANESYVDLFSLDKYRQSNIPITNIHCYFYL